MKSEVVYQWFGGITMVKERRKSVPVMIYETKV